MQAQVAQLTRATMGHQVLMRRGGAHAEVGWRNNYTQHGWPIAEPTVNSVEVGIERVGALHSANAILVFNNCKGYLDEKMSYSYKQDSAFGSSDDIENKSRFHYMDAERYILSGFFDRAKTQGPTQRRSNTYGGGKQERRPRRFGERTHIRRM